MRKGAKFSEYEEQVVCGKCGFHIVNNVKASSQQIKIHKMIGGEINYLIGNIFVDILLADKIIVEYDCWHWHKDVLTKDRRRDEFLKSRGYKILRIKSSHLIPTLEQINEKINLLKTSDKKYQC